MATVAQLLAVSDPADRERGIEQMLDTIPREMVDRAIAECVACPDEQAFKATAQAIAVRFGGHLAQTDATVRHISSPRLARFMLEVLLVFMRRVEAGIPPGGGRRMAA